MGGVTAAAGGSEASGAGVTPDEAVAHVRALAELEVSLAEQLRQAVLRARAAGADSVRLAGALGVHRATLYRRFPARSSNRHEEAEREAL